MRFFNKYFIIGVIICILIVGIFIYHQTHTINTISYHKPTVLVPPDPGGPNRSSLQVSPTQSQNTVSQTTNTSSQSVEYSTPEVNNSIQQQMQPTIQPSSLP